MDDNTLKDPVYIYLQSYPRNKIVVVRNAEALTGMPSLDVGKELALYIRQNELVDIKLDVFSRFIDLVSEYTAVSDNYGPSLCLLNIGILFEPELGFDVTNIIAAISKNTLLFLPWKGEIKNNNLFFLSSHSKNKINLSKFSYIII